MVCIDRAWIARINVKSSSLKYYIFRRYIFPYREYQFIFNPSIAASYPILMISSYFNFRLPATVAVVSAKYSLACYIYSVQPDGYSMSETYGMSFLILESIEEDFNYLLEISNMILHTFVKFLPGEEWAR
jgi:hypothetical protein